MSHTGRTPARTPQKGRHSVVLLSIANSQFVAIDLEMMGITDKVSVERHENPGRQQVYEAAKKIASTFNVFDLGITCIMPQPDGSYDVESYSFPVSPYLHADTYDDEMFVWEVDRRLCVAYDTLGFLRKEGDVRMATQRIEKKMKPRKEREHPYNKSDEGLLFLSAYAWDTIDDWLLENAQNLVPDMRRRSWNYGATVIIYLADDEKDNESLQDRLSASQRKIRLVIEGLAGGDFAALINADRVVEALSACPGNAEAFCEKARRIFQSTSPAHSEDASEDEYDNSDGPGVRFTPQSTDGWYFNHPSAFGFPWQATSAGEVFTGNKESSAESLSDKVAQALQLVENKLKISPPIIVEHNQFMDLLFLYNTFIDDLPDTLDDFFAEIHELFPVVMDTKLLAIEDQAIEGEDPLLDLYNRLSDCKVMPQITWHTAHGYGRSGTAHQAGFDSFMTATVLLRLAYKLARKNLPGDDDEQAGRKPRTLYSREWLSAIGRDPDHFEDQRSSSPC
ncbi:hypothetical protein LY76DRAFT_622738 [Colletotrichum caudatum]|nr:hypothetical protein LY76DRAFT_622738 [Colletotrichum caudatum]